MRDDPDGNQPEISTHTSLAGRDDREMVDERMEYKFLLTRPSRDVTSTSTFHHEKL